MNEISNEVKYAVIIFHDKSHKFITQDQYHGIIMAQSNPNIKNIKLGDNLYYLGGINKILNIEEFYDEYPDKRPDPKFKTTSTYTSLTERVPVSGLPSLVKGLQNFVDQEVTTGKIPHKAMSLLERYKTKQV